MNVTDQRPSNHPNDPPNARLWNMRWFAYLAAPLLFVTIILPILAGPIFRQILQWYIKLRKFWLVGFIIVWSLYTVAMYYLLSLNESSVPQWTGYLMQILYDCSILTITLGQLYIAGKAVRSQQASLRHRILSIVLVNGAIASLLFDLLDDNWPIMGTFAWIAWPSIMYCEYRLDARGKKARTSKNEKSS